LVADGNGEGTAPRDRQSLVVKSIRDFFVGG